MSNCSRQNFFDVISNFADGFGFIEDVLRKSPSINELYTIGLRVSDSILMDGLKKTASSDDVAQKFIDDFFSYYENPNITNLLKTGKFSEVDKRNPAARAAFLFRNAQKSYKAAKYYNPIVANALDNLPRIVKKGTLNAMSGLFQDSNIFALLMKVDENFAAKAKTYDGFLEMFGLKDSNGAVIKNSIPLGVYNTFIKEVLTYSDATTVSKGRRWIEKTMGLFGQTLKAINYTGLSGLALSANAFMITTGETRSALKGIDKELFSSNDVHNFLKETGRFPGMEFDALQGIKITSNGPEFMDDIYTKAGTPSTLVSDARKKLVDIVWKDGLHQIGDMLVRGNVQKHSFVLALVDEGFGDYSRFDSFMKDLEIDDVEKQRVLNSIKQKTLDYYNMFNGFDVGALSNRAASGKFKDLLLMYNYMGSWGLRKMKHTFYQFGRAPKARLKTFFNSQASGLRSVRDSSGEIKEQGKLRESTIAMMQELLSESFMSFMLMNLQSFAMGQKVTRLTDTDNDGDVNTISDYLHASSLFSTFGQGVMSNSFGRLMMAFVEGLEDEDKDAVMKVSYQFFGDLAKQLRVLTPVVKAAGAAAESDNPIPEFIRQLVNNTWDLGGGLIRGIDANVESYNGLDYIPERGNEILGYFLLQQGNRYKLEYWDQNEKVKLWNQTPGRTKLFAGWSNNSIMRLIQNYQFASVGDVGIIEDLSGVKSGRDTVIEAFRTDSFLDDITVNGKFDTKKIRTDKSPNAEQEMVDFVYNDILDVNAQTKEGAKTWELKEKTTLDQIKNFSERTALAGFITATGDVDYDNLLRAAMSTNDANHRDYIALKAELEQLNKGDEARPGTTRMMLSLLARREAAKIEDSYKKYNKATTGKTALTEQQKRDIRKNIVVDLGFGQKVIDTDRSAAFEIASYHAGRNIPGMEKYIKTSYDKITQTSKPNEGRIERRGSLNDTMFMYYDTLVEYYKNNDYGAYLQNSVFASLPKKIKDPAQRMAFTSALIEDLGEVGVDEGILTQIGVGVLKYNKDLAYKAILDPKFQEKNPEIVKQFVNDMFKIDKAVTNRGIEEAAKIEQGIGKGTGKGNFSSSFDDLKPLLKEFQSYMDGNRGDLYRIKTNNVEPRKYNEGRIPQPTRDFLKQLNKSGESIGATAATSKNYFGGGSGGGSDKGDRTPTFKTLRPKPKKRKTTKKSSTK